MSKRIWEQFFQKRGRFYLLPHSSFHKIISKFKTYRISKVIDIGCGSGRHSIGLAKEGFTVNSIDFSKEALNLAKKWAKSESLDIKFKEGNIHKKLPYRSNSFDAAIAIDSIYYENSEAVNFTLDEIKRILKPEGLLFITLPTQVGNPLITHLIFSEKEIIEIISSRFTIIDKFMDKRKYSCLFALNQIKDKVVNLKF